jgi:hypothetical protein
LGLKALHGQAADAMPVSIATETVMYVFMAIPPLVMVAQGNTKVPRAGNSNGATEKLRATSGELEHDEAAN